MMDASELHIEHQTEHYTAELDGLMAVWHGGEYIEIGRGDPWTGEFGAEDVINVWDYELSKPRYPFTEEGFRRALANHFAEEDKCEGCSDSELPGVRWPTRSNDDGTRFWIERCDVCEVYDDDRTAADALVEADLIDDWDLAKPVGSTTPTPFQIWTSDPLPDVEERL